MGTFHGAYAEDSTFRVFVEATHAEGERAALSTLVYYLIGERDYYGYPCGHNFPVVSERL